VLRIVGSSGAAQADYRYRDQLLGAASAVSKDVTEGFLRHSAATFARFLDYGLGSLVEAETRLTDGVERGYFTDAQCAQGFRLARRCLTAMVRLKKSQQQYLQRDRDRGP